MKETKKEETQKEAKEETPVKKNALKRFKEFLDVVRGKEDFRSKFNVLVDPVNLKTSSRLTAGQVEFVTDAFFVTKHFPRFKPLRDLAIELLQVAPSHKGQRIEEVIRFQQATRPTEGNQNIGFFGSVRQKVRARSKEATNIEQ